ncbi:hypothetical protein L596_028786 [Steinernema carpocapsae]|uniref:Uncharacterized protein n=1 Tax=Steinernema carpocapsae TaxID=34508 RepID=A0A4U5LZC3_STECR|nr:hypothetical protein L596_028786 [Steinernema carpocapsae]
MADSEAFPDIRAYSTVYPTAGSLIIYWFQDSEILGVTDAREIVFEKTFDASERGKFLGNVAASLVEQRWNGAMKDQKLTISEMTSDDVTLNYLINRVTLHKLEPEEAKNRLQKFVLLLIKELIVLRKEEVKQEAPVLSKRSKNAPVIEKAENQSSLDKTKKVRRRPAGR